MSGLSGIHWCCYGRGTDEWTQWDTLVLLWEGNWWVDFVGYTGTAMRGDQGSGLGGIHWHCYERGPEEWTHWDTLALLWEGTRGVDSVGYTGTAMRRDLRSGHSRDGTERRLVELTCWGWHLITWRKNSEKSVIYSREHDTFYTLLVSEILFVPFQLCTPAKDISCGQSLFRCFFTRHLVSWGQG